MAQRLIHYLLGEMLSKEIELKNKERFLLGSVMPDAYKELKYRDKTHFANRTDGTYFDFNLFREKIWQTDERRLLVSWLLYAFG